MSGNREAMRLRRPDGGAALRPTDQTNFNSALRSDFEYVPPTADYSETYMRVRSRGYDGADVFFLPSDVPADNTYGIWNCLTVVRSPAGTPITNLDGVEIARYEYTKRARVVARALTSNVVTITTLDPHTFTAGEQVIVGDLGAPFDGTYTIVATPTATTFTYAKTNTDVASATAYGFAVEVNSVQPIPDDQGAVVRDVGLTPGQWYYYALFARYQTSGVTLWVRVSISDLLVPIDFGSTATLWSMVPEYYRQLDSEQGGHYEANGVLHRFVRVLGYEVDVQRTWALTVGDLWDVERISSRILPQLGTALGLDYEGAIGDKRFRALLNNIMYLRKIKGTIDGIEGYLGALTGYRTLTYLGPNMILNNNVAEARYAVGWESGIVNQNVTRVVSAGEANGPANGFPYHTLTNATGGSATGTLRMGTTATAFDIDKAVPVVAAHQYKMTFDAKHSEASKSVIVNMDFYDANGGFLSTVSSSAQSLAGAGAWTVARVSSGWLTAPANARYMTVRLTTASMSNAATFSIDKVLIVDRAWRPIGIAAKQDVEPLSSSAAGVAGTYEHIEYYESSRRIHSNLYPQRTNFALNSNFSVDGAHWVSTEPTSYELLRSTFTSYSQIESTETDYTDLLREFDILGTSTTISWDVARGELIANNAATAAPFMSQFSSNFFPVNGLTPFSARIEARSDHGNTTVRLRFKWYSDDIVTSEVFEQDPVTGAVIHRNGPYFSMGDGSTVQYLTDELGRPLLDEQNRPLLIGEIQPKSGMTSCYISNIKPPAAARYGRLVVESVNQTHQHEDRFAFVLIEDKAQPGTYFDGNVVEGAPGDFAFVGGVDYEGFSIYYQNYQVLLGGSGNRVGATLPTLVPPDRDTAVVTAYTTSGVSATGLF